VSPRTERQRQARGRSARARHDAELERQRLLEDFEASLVEVHVLTWKRSAAKVAEVTPKWCRPGCTYAAKDDGHDGPCSNEGWQHGDEAVAT